MWLIVENSSCQLSNGAGRQTDTAAHQWCCLMETNVLSGQTSKDQIPVWNLIQQACKQRWKGKHACPAFVIFRSKREKKTVPFGKTFQKNVSKWMKLLLAYGCNMKSALLWYKQSVVPWRKRADISHRTNLAISLCRLHSTRASGQRRPLTAAASTLLHNVASAWRVRVGEAHIYIKAFDPHNTRRCLQL